MRLGLAWAVLTCAALAGGRGVLAIWLGAAGCLAAWQAGRGWRRRARRPQAAVAAVAALVLSTAGLLSPLAVLAAAVATVVAAVAAGPRRSAQGAGRRSSGPGQPLRPDGSSASNRSSGSARLWASLTGGGRHIGSLRAGRLSPMLTVAVAFAGGAAGAGAVLAERGGSGVALALLALAAAYDAGSYLVGSEASGPWEGPVAGVLATIPVALIMATVADPRGPGPWVLAVVAAVLAPAGARLGAILRGDHRAPAMGRLDSLILLAPAWALLAPWLLG